MGVHHFYVVVWSFVLQGPNSQKLMINLSIT